MKISYHPPHLILVHFPAALLPMDLACSILGRYLGHEPLLHAAFYALAGGVLVGWLAVLAGFIDLVRIPRRQADALRTALIHGGINTAILIPYSVLLYRQWSEGGFEAPGYGMLAGKAVLLAALVVGNYLGAQLVLRYGIGTVSNHKT